MRQFTYQLSAMLCTMRYSPVTLLHRSSGLVAIGALLLSACSSGSQPAATPEAGQPVVTLIAVDREKDVAVSPVQSGAQSPVIGGIDGVSGTLRTGGTLLVVGWAVDLQYGSPVTRVDVVIDGKRSVQAVLGDERPDIVNTQGRNDARLSGWLARLSLDDVTAGSHNLTVLVYDTQQRAHILPFSYLIQIE
jgi:hypothetical protein